MSKPERKEIARVLRSLSRYADGHELRGQWKAELVRLKKEAEEMACELEQGQ